MIASAASHYFENKMIIKKVQNMKWGNEFEKESRGQDEMTNKGNGKERDNTISN